MLLELSPSTHRMWTALVVEECHKWCTDLWWPWSWNSNCWQKESRILWEKRYKQFWVVKLAHHGVLSAVVIFPPIIIFNRRVMKAELTDGAPARTTFSLNQSGWRQLETCRFNVFCVMSSWWSVLLAMDVHVTHTKNLFVNNERGWKRNSTYRSFWLQQYLHIKSVDVSFIFSLKKLCVSAVGTWPDFM